MSPSASPSGPAVLHVHSLLDARGQVVRSWVESVAGGDASASIGAQVVSSGGVVDQIPRGHSRSAREDQNAAAAGDDAAAERVLRRFLGGEDLHADFAGQSAREIMADREVKIEIAALLAAGCTNAAELVLRGGLHRCRQVRQWVERKRSSQRIENPAALMASRILNGVPAEVLHRRRSHH